MAVPSRRSIHAFLADAPGTLSLSGAWDPQALQPGANASHWRVLLLAGEVSGGSLLLSDKILTTFFSHHLWRLQTGGGGKIQRGLVFCSSRGLKLYPFIRELID